MRTRERKNYRIEEIAQELERIAAKLQGFLDSRKDAEPEPIIPIPERLRSNLKEILGEQRRQETSAKTQALEWTQINQMLQGIIEAMPIGAIIADADGNILMTNDEGNRILGVSVEGNVENPLRLYETYRPNGTRMAGKDLPLYQALHEGRVIRDVEILIRQPDDTEKTILSSAIPIRDPHGKIICGIVIFQDISERQRTLISLNRFVMGLKVLRETDQAILSAQPNSEVAAAILHWLPELIGCVFSSITLFEAGGTQISLAALQTEPVKELSLPQTFTMAESSVIEKLSQGNIHAVRDFQAVDVRPFWNQLPVEEAIMGFMIPILTPEKLIGSLNIGMTNTAMLNAEQLIILRELANQVAIGITHAELRDQLSLHMGDLEKKSIADDGKVRSSEARFQSIFDDSVLGMALLDSDGKIVFTNTAIQKILGYQQSELEGEIFDIFSHSEDKEIDQDLHRALHGGEIGHFRRKKRFVRKDGQVRWSDLSVNRVKPKGETTPGLAIFMLEDITEKLRDQQALLQAEKLSIAGRLGVSLAHEINNPLQSTLGLLGLAEESMTEESKGRKYMTVAMDELDRAARIVTQLRNLGKESDAKPKKEPTNLNELLERTFIITRGRRQNRGVKVVWEPIKDLPLVMASADNIQQVLLNLILNAIESMKDGGTITVHTSITEKPEGVRVLLSDTGTGIDAEQLRNIFTPFQSTRPDGMGLGLFISKKIIDEHNGRIEVSSCVGQGTTFKIWLPVEKANEGE